MRFTNLHRRAIVLAGAFAAAGLSRAAEPAARVYGVLSLIGDEFSVVTRRNTVGSSLDTNERHAFAIDGAELDDVAVVAAQRALERSLPAAPLRVSIRDPRLYALEDRLLGDDAEVQAMRDSLRGVLQKAGITDLVLVTKRRQEASFDLAHGSIGSGKLQGVGFYIDDHFRTTRRSTGERADGILGVYAYATVALVEIESMRVLKSRDAGATKLTTPAHSQSAVRAWDSLGSAGKMKALDAVVTKAVGEAVAELFAA